MQTAITFSWLAVAVLAVLVITGNYLVNRRQGMREKENRRETEMWGLGFLIYALIDFFIVVL